MLMWLRGGVEQQLGLGLGLRLGYNDPNFTDVCMVWWGAGERGGGTNLPPTIQTSVNFHNLTELLYLRTL